MQLRTRRIPVEVRTEFTVDDQSYTTVSKNIATRGICFETVRRLSVGEEAHILLYIPTREDFDLIKIQAEVAWVKDLEGSWMVGAAFRKFAPRDDVRLRDWLLKQIKR